MANTKKTQTVPRKKRTKAEEEALMAKKKAADDKSVAKFRPLKEGEQVKYFRSKG